MSRTPTPSLVHSKSPQSLRIISRRTAKISVVAFCILTLVATTPGCQDSTESVAEQDDHDLVASAKLATAPIMAQGRHAEAMAERRGRRDPSRDGWVTEVLAENVAEQLHKFAALIEDPGRISRASVSQLCSPQLTTTELRPVNLISAFADKAFEVVRMGTPTADPQPCDAVEFAEKVRRLAFPFTDLSDVHAKFKVTHIEAAEDGANSTLIYTAYGAGGARSVQQNATWRCEWVTTGDARIPTLATITLTAFEEIRGPRNNQTLFSDSTAAIFSKEPIFETQLRHGVNFWQARIQNSVGLDFFGHQGIALGDVNQDQLDDLYVCQPGGLPNRLFLHQSDGTLIDASKEYGVDILDSTSSALFVDLNNDGYQDLVTVSPTRVLIYRNHNGQVFRRQRESSIDLKASFSLSAADYDADRYLDLYVCGYSYPTGKAQVPTPYHDANNGYRNWLLRNEGQFSFRDVTAEVGLDQNNRRFSFSSAWEDYDNDGDQDLYVANDYGRNNLYRNDSGQFTDVAAEAGVEDISAGMSVTWGDYNNDGSMDLYVSNMFSSAGQRVTYNRHFRHAEAEEVDHYQRHARGNSLFENRGDGTFDDVTLEQNVALGRWAWGSLFVDLNNDSWQDLVICNGNLTGPETDDL